MSNMTVTMCNDKAEYVKTKCNGVKIVNRIFTVY